LKKANFIVTLLSAYIIIAFTWWIYAHYKNNNTIYEQQVLITEYKCYEASFEMERLRDGDMFEDTTDAKNFFYSKYPDLELIYLDSIIPLNAFMVRPKLKTYIDLEDKYKRRFIMYLTEGIVMIMLLLWGIVKIYETFRKSLQLRKLQSNFLLSVTHELKTPIAAVKLYLETLIKRNLSQDQTKQIAANAVGDINRLQSLVENLLLSAQIDSNKLTLNFTKENLSELITSVAHKFALPRNLNERMQLDIKPDVYALIDKSAIEMLMNNLLSNAEKYSEGPLVIKITLNCDDKYINLQIADNGIGISKNDKKLIFSKFYRSGDELTRKTKGTGLGLFIVFNIVQQHKGQITVLDNKPNGSIFNIKLPKNYATQNFIS
jgi:signal transduction histidine kinase